MIESKTFAVYDASSRERSLGDISIRLLGEQKLVWPQLASGYASLASVQQRELQCNGYRAWLQFNPGRIVSTGANVDARSISERTCFLCLEHLPPTQQGILYAGDFLVLCNPVPIFNEHFTVSHVRHIPQAIEPFLVTFLSLARDLHPRFSIFYNGPRCGASAPDHMHFQACPTGTIPVEDSAREERRRISLRSLRGVDILTLAEFGRTVLVFESRSDSALAGCFIDVLAAWNLLTGSTDEPMMNVICSHADSGWRVILFPRSKHRPDVYFRDGEERILISPAAVDIGGLIVTPVEKDFRAVDAGRVESMFREVSVPDQLVRDVVASLS